MKGILPTRSGPCRWVVAAPDRRSAARNNPSPHISRTPFYYTVRGQKWAPVIRLEAKRWIRPRSSCSEQWPHCRARTLALCQRQPLPIPACPRLVLHPPRPPFRPEDQPCFPYRIGGLSRYAAGERPFPWHLLSTCPGPLPVARLRVETHGLK